MDSKIYDSLSLTAEKDDSYDSIGILNMDNIKAFGENTSGMFSTKEINEKLKVERNKALELLEIASQRDLAKNINKMKTDSIKISNTPDSLKLPKTPGFDRTDYISYNSYKTLNITELQEEHTINLESTEKIIPAKPNKISFEPSEITGRSTLYRGELRKKPEDLTVEEILSSSYSGNVRNLGQSLRLNSIGTTDSQNRSSVSLPKTADMSKTSGTESLMFTTHHSSKRCTFSNARRDDESSFMGESFTPAELMTSKLYADELAWGQEHLPIPPTELESSYRSGQNKNFDNSDFSINCDINNISRITDFFRKRSENLYNIVSSSESPQSREPVALIDDTMNSTMSDATNDRNRNQLKTNKVNDKTYSRKSDDYKNDIKGAYLNEKTDERKDESYILSVSSIANALKEISSDESVTNVMNRLLLPKRTKSGLNLITENLTNKNSMDSRKSYSLDPKYYTQIKDYNQNKENHDPILQHDKDNIKHLSDTATFTESLLDTSDFKRIIQNDTYDSTLDDRNDKHPLINITEFNQNTLKSFKSCSQLKELNKSISSSKHNLSPNQLTSRRSKSPSNPNELYAAAGASSKNLLLPIPTKELTRKRSRSACNHNTESKITNPTAETAHKGKIPTKSYSSTHLNNERTKKSSISPNFHDTRNNIHSPSSIGTHEKFKFDKSSRKLMSYPNSPNSSIHDDLNDARVSNPTITIDSIREIRRENNLKKAHSSTRLNNEVSEIRSLSPNFHGTRTDFRSPSPIQSKEKSKFHYSPMSSLYNSPRSIVSSPKYHNSPNSPNSLETTTISERRYLMAGGNHNHYNHNHIPSSVSTVSPDSLGKMSLPNYGLVSQQSSNLLLVKASSRCNSQCSSSSEFSHHDDKKLPIKVTSTQFSWGSIKLRTNSKKSMQIKNFSTKRLVLKVQISGPGFQIINLDNCGNLITLQSQECRSIVINFCPTVLGKAIGILSFQSPQENSLNAHRIPLYGYGGHAVAIPQGIQKGPIGLPFITMGELQELSRPLVRTFTIYNKGPLNAFVVICLSSLGLVIPRLCECIDIEPKKALVRPDDIVKFRITFKPRRDDLKKIIKKISDVMTLATLTIITGDEPTRQRIRNIIHKMNDMDKSKITSTTLDNCWKKFEQEILLNDLNEFKEQTDVAMELVSTLRTHEIAITLNHTVMDDTATSSHLMFPDVDETIMFRTIVSNSIYLKSPVVESRNNHNINVNNGLEKRPNELWSVRPNKLEIDPFDKRTKSFFTLRSLCDTIMQDFEITSNFKHLFTINPSSGKLSPNESIDINVNFNQLSFLPKEEINIMVFIENEKITIPVKIKKDNFPPNLR